MVTNPSTSTLGLPGRTPLQRGILIPLYNSTLSSFPFLKALSRRQVRNLCEAGNVSISSLFPSSSSPGLQCIIYSYNLKVIQSILLDMLASCLQAVTLLGLGLGLGFLSAHRNWYTFCTLNLFGCDGDRGLHLEWCSRQWQYTEKVRAPVPFTSRFAQKQLHCIEFLSCVKMSSEIK